MPRTAAVIHAKVAVLSVASGVLLAPGVVGQSDPSGFGTVYNIGTVPPGSIFDVPGAVTGAVVGGGTGLVTPTFLQGNVLGSDNQFNLCTDGSVLCEFNFGPVDASGFNIEVNVLGGAMAEQLDVLAGATVNVFEGSIGGSLRLFEGAELNVYGGEVGVGLGAFSSSTVNLHGGRLGSVDVGSSFGGGSTNVTFNMSGGSVDRFIDANPGSMVSITGGTVEQEVVVLPGGEVSLAGGYIASIRTNQGSVVEVSGGNIGRLSEFGLSDIVIQGGDFASGGVVITDETEVSVGVTSPLFTGIYSDGTAFIFASESVVGLGSDSFRASLIQAPVPPSSNPGELSSGIYSKGLRSGETLTVTAGGELSDFFSVVGGTLNIEGGTAGERLKVVAGDINIRSGSVGEGVAAYAGGTINLSGGGVGELAGVFDNAVFNVSGGVVALRLEVASGGMLNASGGFFDGEIYARLNSTVHISGGVVRDRLLCFGCTARISGGSFEGPLSPFLSGGGVSADSGTIDLEGIKFFLDGVEMDGLVLDQPFEIADTDAMLGGFLADGSPFEFRLSSTLSDSIRPAVTLRVTRVPNLNTCPTDLSGDGTTNFPDLLLVLASFGSDANGDTNLDFVTDLADLLAVLADFGQACP